MPLHGKSGTHEGLGPGNDTPEARETEPREPLEAA